MSDHDVAMNIFLDNPKLHSEIQTKKLTKKNCLLSERSRLHVSPEIVRETRENLKMSRSIFADRLCVSPRTLEKWEQGATIPNEQAAALILLVRKYPDTLARLETLNLSDVNYSIPGDALEIDVTTR